MPNPSLVRVLARSLAAGEQSVEHAVGRAARTLGREWRWLRPLARRYLKATQGRARPRHADVMRFLLEADCLLSRRDIFAPMERRTFLTGAAVPLVAAAVGKVSAQTPATGGGRIRQSVMASVWTGSTVTSFEERCRILARIGFKGVDLPNEKQVPILTQNGLAPGMMVGTGTSFKDGLIRKELHDKIEEATHAGIDMCVRSGCKVLIAIPGERRGMSREEGADNAVAILSRVKGYAEQKGVNVCMEITNSKIAADQRTDQVFDHVAWGLDVCKRVNSPRVKILYDIYHAQIMDGDITRTLRENIDHICHIHVAGVPTRQEIDDKQELNFRFIAGVIADLPYTGFVAHEWRPSPGNDSVKDLERCFGILNV